MNPQDAIILALTPGSPFNDKGLVFRSTHTLAAFAGIEPAAVMDLLVGDLAQEVVCKPSKKNKGVMVALKAQLQAQAAAPIKVAGGPAFNAPPVAANPAPVAKEAEVDLEEDLEDDLDDEDDAL